MKRLTVLTGAGISQESGIQTFRDVDGLWMGHKVTDVASPEGWKKNKKLVLDFYNARRRQLDEVQPNLAHKVLADLEKYFDVKIITQNVDDLHERAGSTNVIHLHGELKKMCSSLNKEKTLPYEKNIELGDKHPDGSHLRPFIVWFGESVPLYSHAIEAMRNSDIFIIIGTSMQVTPASQLINFYPVNNPLFILDKKIPEFEGSDNYSRFVRIEKSATEGIIELREHLSKLL